MRIKIYGTEWCPFCVKAKTFFEENNINFEYIDVDSDEEAANYILEQTNQAGIPVIEFINDEKSEFVIGFNEEEVKKKLKIK